jgi:hypothetical protein
MSPSTTLSDILKDGNRAQLIEAWASTEPAEDFVPLPAGQYVAHVISGELFSSQQKGTPGYKLAFKVLEGEHVGRRFWYDLWLTPAALPMAKRDLGKLGITTLEQLDQPVPRGIRCKVKLVVRKDDSGAEYNRVRSFCVLGIDRPEPDAFAPVETPAAPEGDGAEGSGPLPVKPDDGIPV